MTYRVNTILLTADANNMLPTPVYATSAQQHANVEGNLAAKKLSCPPPMSILEAKILIYHK